ncbi:MAG TPA: carboxypeptidase-like regulatory domain-containing protein, partial [Vicinamibacterales bacterium]|nr:carboxypeptidase-like regulatory domain-containing protein [Vicinamibacterales bacterium]
MRGVLRVLAVFLALSIAPVTVFAQTTLSGVARDTSGSVMPGVTVEASSPALIEKVRAATTDSDGFYRIPDLPPGTYRVTFSLSGFSTFVRQDVTLTGGGVTTINADMRVGAVTEAITVSGEAPVVDVQTSTRRQVVISSEVLQEIPASRGYGNILATVPGIQATTLDISSAVSTNFFTARGGRGNEGTIQ